MADVTNIKWVYPPNFEGTFEEGTKNGYRRYIVKCTNYSDGTGEDEVIKVKRTDLLTSSGQVPGRLVIEKIDYDISGMTVKIGYDNVNEDIAALLYSSAGTLDFTQFGGFVPMEDDTDTGGGNIIFTTDNATSLDSYDITLTVRAKD
jgi:hypothetical protein